jgi:hypothetical protein
MSTQKRQIQPSPKRYTEVTRFFFVLLCVAVLHSYQTQAQLCQNTSYGFPPLNDLGSNFWRGAQGGLYPNGENSRPSEHNENGILLASQITPLNELGVPDPLGRIVFLSVGMSNALQEFVRFQSYLANVQNLNPSLKAVNGAQGGWAIDDIIFPNSPFWNNIRGFLRQLKLSEQQVQVIWFKEADFHPDSSASDTTFAGYTDSLKEKFKIAITIAKQRYPNLKIAYIASRVYGGYDETLAHPEPYAYYQGWAVKSLIEDQINGDSSLVYLGPNAKAPWLSWGPYLWADGINPRGDGLTWICPDDFEPDGRHPSELGEEKVASMLMNSLLTDETATPWFLDGTTAVPGSNNNIPETFSIVNYPNPFNPSTTIEFVLPQPGYTELSIYNTLGQQVESLIARNLDSGKHSVTFDSGEKSGGVYIYVLRAGDLNVHGKMIFLR